MTRADAPKPDPQAPKCCLLDAHGQILSASAALAVLLGIRVQDSARHSLLEFIHPEDRALHTPFKTTSDYAFRQMLRIRRHDGSYGYMGLSGMRDPDSRKLFVHLTDLSGSARGMSYDFDVAQIVRQKDEELLDLQERFRQAQKLEAVGRLAGGVAHDFNNLLTVILGQAEMTLLGLPEDSPIRPDIEEIRRAGEKASALTQQLLAFSRKKMLRPRVLNLNAIVRNLDKMLRRLIGEDIEILTRLDPHLRNVVFDPTQAEQIIMNLVVNARDAMPNGGTLTIETANIFLSDDFAGGAIFSVKSGPHVLLSISDTGIGMEEETLRHAFEPFFTTKDRSKGTGLGLSTVYGIIKQSGGNIWLYSEPGKGTTVKIYLPRADQPESIADDPEPRPIRHGFGQEILLVEDDDKVRATLTQMLRGEKFTIHEAGSGDEAIRLFERQRDKIALLLVDLVMPKMSGPEVARRLAAIKPDIRTIFMSGYSEPTALLNRSLPPGAHFLEKPITRIDLLSSVHKALQQAP